MDIKTIITIGRQFGSGGRYIGETIAKRFGIPFHDRDLIALAAEKSGMNKKLLEDADEKSTSTFMHSFAVTAFAPGSRVSLPSEISINDRLFFAQAEIIKEAAQRGPCVIVGRCADYILRERDDCINIFIHADLESRIERATTLYGIKPNEAKNTILKTDKKRAGYYNYYTNQEWGDMMNCDLTINSALMGVEKTADIIVDFVKLYDAKD